MNNYSLSCKKVASPNQKNIEYFINQHFLIFCHFIYYLNHVYFNVCHSSLFYTKGRKYFKTGQWIKEYREAKYVLLLNNSL